MTFSVPSPSSRPLLDFAGSRLGRFAVLVCRGRREKRHQCGTCLERRRWLPSMPAKTTRPVDAQLASRLEGWQRWGHKGVDLKMGRSFLLTARSFLLTARSLLVTVIWFGLFCSWLKILIGFVFFTYGSPCPEIGVWSFLLTVPPPPGNWFWSFLLTVPPP